MPIFEYRGDECGTRFEKLVRRPTDEIVCPSCGESHLKQELSTFAAHSGGQPAERALPTCGGGMCRMPDVCGRN